MGRKHGATSHTIEEHSYRQGKYPIDDPRKTEVEAKMLMLL